MDMKRLYTLATILLAIYKVRAADDDVRIPPRLRVSPPREIIFKSGVQVTLPCEADGRPPVKEYEWTKNGLTLDLNSPYIVPSADETVGTILITPQDARDEGKYRCSAKNQWGTAVSDNSHAILAFIQSLPQLPSTTTTTTEGDPLRLPCTQTKSAPNVTYFWSTGSSTIDPNTVPILPSSRLSVSDQGDLYFAYTTPEDNQKNRIYKCNLKNAELDTTLGGSYTTIKVTSRSIDQMPVAQKYASQPTLTAIKGRPFNFRCIFSGKPAPKIEWQRQNGALDSSRSEQQDYNTRLIIKSVIEDDAGTYTCTGSQPETAGSNTVTHSMTLAVKVVPEFANDADSPHDINATEGGTVSISCKSYAVPAATVKWFKDGVPLQSNQKQQLSTDGLTLTLVDLCRDSTVCGKPDLMVISCNASNDYGYAYASGFVNVLKKSVITNDLPKSIELAPPQPQELTCEGSSDPGTTVSINWFFNGYLITNESGKYEVYNNPGSTLLRIMTTEQARGGRLAGSYMCNVTNGYSSSVQSIDITLPPGFADGLATASIPWWIIVTILMIILFLVIIFLCCYQCIKRNKGDLYEVDKSERETGNDPEKDLIIAGYHDYQRQEETDAPAVLKSARGSLGSVMTLSNEPFERGTGPMWNMSTEDLTAA